MLHICNVIRNLALSIFLLVTAGVGPVVAGDHSYDAMIKKSRDLLANAPTIEKRRSVAVNQFWGFYYSNTKTRSDVCRSIGVSIPQFMAAFQKAHANEIAIASAIYKQKHADPERIFQDPKLQNIFWWAISRELTELGTQLGTSQAGACKSMEDYADQYVPLNTLRKRRPDIFNALHAR